MPVSLSETLLAGLLAAKTVEIGFHVRMHKQTIKNKTKVNTLWQNSDINEDST